MLLLNCFYFIYAISFDCPDVINLAIGLTINVNSLGIWSALNVDCCNTIGVSCDGNERVTAIDWNNMGLEGGFINGSAIPQTVVWFRLVGNLLSGPFPKLPVALLVTDLRGNKLSGNIIFPLPPSLQTFFITGNSVDGILQPFPSTTTKIQIDYNHFSGTLSLSKPIGVVVIGNRITDVIIQDTRDFSWCDLSNNPLLGNPNISNLTMCTQNELYDPIMIQIDCPNMINFAFGLGMEAAQHGLWSALLLDCCTASGVTCIGQRVTQIVWSDIGLNGFINGSAIPSRLTILTLTKNQINGSIPSDLPSGLTKLSLGYNRLTGNIPDSLPNNLIDFSVRGNQMSGDLPLFPNALVYLYLGYPGYFGNHFTGSLSLNRPIILFINNNWIADVIIQNSSLLTSVNCDLSNNPLYGNANLVNVPMCKKDGLYNASSLSTKQITFQTNGLFTFNISKTLYVQQFLSTNTIGTVEFQQILIPFEIDFAMALKFILSWMILLYVLLKTPFLGALKRITKRTNEKVNTVSSD